MSHGYSSIPTVIKRVTVLPITEHAVRSKAQRQPRIMLVLKWISALALATFAASADTDVKELTVVKSYVPAECPVKSQKGDKIYVHYVSRGSLRLFSRFVV